MDRMTGYGAGSQWEPFSTDRVGRRDPVDPGSIPGGSVSEYISANFNGLADFLPSSLFPLDFLSALSEIDYQATTFQRL